MENLMTIQNVLNQKNNYNLAIPFVESQQVNPFFKLRVSLLNVNTDPRAKEIYKVGSQSIGGGKFEDLYTLAKPFLERLATEAGIQFAPGYGDVVKIDDNTWKSCAFGAIRLPDGSARTSNNFKIIDLLTEEKKYRFAYQEKAAHGITDRKAAVDASKKYSGQWQGETFVVAESDREKYVERSLLEAMAQLRSSAPQKAATGAILRVIRELLGIKSMYTIDELRKPFAVARMSFSPDYNDPVVKQMMIQQAMQSVGNLFGNIQPVTQTISIPQNTSVDDEIDFPADPVVDDYSDVSKEILKESHDQHQCPTQDAESGSRSHEQQKSDAQPEQEDRSMDFCCDKCGAVIPERVWDYSVNNFGRPLCYKCQKIEKGNRR